MHGYMFRPIIRSPSGNSDNINLKITIANYIEGQIEISVLELHSAQ